MTPIERAIAEIRASAPLANHAVQLLELARPHIRLTPREGTAADNALGASRLAGDPDLPAGTPWPIGPGFDGDAPMDFIAQIDLDAVSRRDVDRLLPRSGVLAFFVAQTYDGCAVIHGEHDSLVRVTKPGSDAAKRWGGFEIEADIVLPPPWTQFVSGTERGPVWNPRTGEREALPAIVELDRDAYNAYADIHEKWLEAVGHDQHGMLGYERGSEFAQRPDELVLLRIDENPHTEYDFVELVAIYWFITRDSLVGHAFGDVEAYCGTTI